MRGYTCFLLITPKGYNVSSPVYRNVGCGMRGLVLCNGATPTELNSFLMNSLFNHFVVVLRGLVTTHIIRGYVGLTPLGLLGSCFNV